jgi:NADPH:quinone reductase-like Zn-dependent oxidoreductase
MKAWNIAPEFGLSHLFLTDLPQVQLKDYQVRVKIKACSLNYRDLMVAKGLYNPAQPLPLIPVSDGAGEVIEVGVKVSDFKVGDHVCALFSQSWLYGRTCDHAQSSTLGSPLPGMLAEQGIFHEQGLIKFPSYLSFEEASSLPCAGVTAFNALSYEAQVRPGSWVFLEGTGGVSIFALQFAKALGCSVIISSSSNDKLAHAQALDADHIINYRDDPKWHESVLKLTNKKGVDAVIEVGGSQTINEAVKATKRGGVICVIGIVSGSSGPLDLIPVLMKQIRILGVFVGAKTVFESMNRVLEHTRIRPVISKVFNFADAPAAFKYLESAQHMGKVVININ